MAIQQQQQEQNQPTFFLDALYCEEDKWEEEDENYVGEVLQEESSRGCNNGRNHSFFPLLLLEQDLFWEDEELLSLFSKEIQQQPPAHLNPNNVETDHESLAVLARREAVEWMLKVIARYGFTTLTAVLSINYLDRFLISSFHFQRDKPWMIHLVAVTCLSLAAKVEETQVPLLLDLQVEETKYVFEAKTIQRMELLVLSTLKWKMHPITPLSFLDHIIRRLGLKTHHLHREFHRRCERLLLCVISDSRSAHYLPSVLATATMMHVIDQVEPFNPIDYQNQLLSVLKINKEKVNDCYKLILDLSTTRPQNNAYSNNPPTHLHKRKLETVPRSPSGMIDAAFSSDSSIDSWGAVRSFSSPEPPLKKSRAQEQGMRLSSLNRVFVDIVGSPA